MKGIKILERILIAIPTMLAIAMLVFVLMRIMPGDPVDKMMGESGNVSIEEVQALEKEFHLDLPLFEQLKIFVIGIFHGDLGISFQERRPVWDIIIERVPATIELALGALIFSLIVAMPIGIISAVKQNSLIDRLGKAFAFL
ncbi:MAG: ABC transporter permease [Candidatus Caldatribacteriota bacterium]|nr:ABC transporter permease [Candidatus Caldatribacteriota bacterium]